MHLTKFVAFLIAVPAQASAAPLEDAARIAAELCASLSAPSISMCGASMPGATEQHQLARRAVRDYQKSRNSFMEGCLESKSLSLCTYETEWLTQSGIDSALIKLVKER